MCRSSSEPGRAVTLAHKRFGVPGGSTRPVMLHVSRDGLRRLAYLRSLRILAVAAAGGAAGNPAETKTHIGLLRSRRVSR
jgi:hypothetical protein